MNANNALAPRPAEQAVQQVNPAAALLAVPRGELAKALAVAIRSCKSVAKADRNEYHRYQYASADSIIAEGRHALAAADLALLPVEASLVGWDREGADRFELVRTFLLVHGSGESAPLRVVWPVCVEKGRPLDKATAAADTLSLSYLLRDLLLMDRVDPADDVSGRDDRPRQEAPAARAKTKRPPPADGAELEARLRKREADLVAAGRCKPGELIAFVVGKGTALGMPDQIARWDPAAAQSVADWSMQFNALHPKPAAQPRRPARVTEAQAQEVLALLERKGRKWPLLRDLLDMKGLALPADMTPEQHADALRMLNEEPDAPARK